MKQEQQICDLVLALRHAMQKDNSVLESQVSEAMNQSEWVISFANDTDAWVTDVRACTGGAQIPSDCDFGWIYIP